MYLAKVSHLEKKADGTTKTAVFAALLQAISHSDAETQIMNLVEEEAFQDPRVTSIVPKSFSDIFSDGRSTEEEPFFTVKIIFFTENHRGKPKKIRNQAVVKAKSTTDADSIVREQVKTIMMPFVIDEIKQTTWNAVYTEPVSEAAELIDDGSEENEQ